MHERRCAEAARARHRAHDERHELERVAELEARHPSPPPDLTAAITWLSRRLSPCEAGVAAGSRRRCRERARPSFSGAWRLSPVPAGETAAVPEVRRAAEALSAATQSRRVHEQRRPDAPPPPPTTQAVEQLQDLARALEAPPRRGPDGSWLARSAPILVAAALIAVFGFAALAATRNPLWLGAAVAIALLTAITPGSTGTRFPRARAGPRACAGGGRRSACHLGLPMIHGRCGTSRTRWRTTSRWRLSASAGTASTRPTWKQNAPRRGRCVPRWRSGARLSSRDMRPACAARRQQASSAALRGPLEQQLATRRELEARASRAAEEARSALESLRAVAAAVPGSTPPPARPQPTWKRSSTPGCAIGKRDSRRNGSARSNGSSCRHCWRRDRAKRVSGRAPTRSARPA